MSLEKTGVEVKLHAQDGEMYVYARFRNRLAKERARRLRQLRGLLHRLALDGHRTPRAIHRPRAQGPRTLHLPAQPRQIAQGPPPRRPLPAPRQHARGQPSDPWNFYIQLTEVEAAFRTLKNDLDLRPIYHQLDSRIEAHIFISFLAYCIHVNLRARLCPHAPGLTSWAVLDKFAAIQMLDVHYLSTDERPLLLRGYTQPEADQKTPLKKTKTPTARPTPAPPHRHPPTPALKKSSP